MARKRAASTSSSTSLLSFSDSEGSDQSRKATRRVPSHRRSIGDLTSTPPTSVTHSNAAKPGKFARTAHDIEQAANAFISLQSGSSGASSPLNNSSTLEALPISSHAHAVVSAAASSASSSTTAQKSRRLSPEVVVYIDKNGRSVSLSAASSTPVTSGSSKMVTSARVMADAASSDDEPGFKPASALLSGNNTGKAKGIRSTRTLLKMLVKEEESDSELSDVDMLSEQGVDYEDEQIAPQYNKSNGKSASLKSSASPAKVDKGKGRAKYEYTEEDAEQAKRIIEKMREKLDQKITSAKAKSNGKAAKVSYVTYESKGKGKARVTASDLEQGSDSDMGPSRRADGFAKRKIVHKMRVKDAEDFDDDRDFEMNEEDAELTNSEDDHESELSDISSENDAANAQDGSIASVARAVVRKQRLPRGQRVKREKMTWWQKNDEALRTHHPELREVWDDLKLLPVPKPHKADQPDGLTLKLLPFQQEGLHWMLFQEKGPWRGGMLADEMGMGKTIQTIALILSDYDPNKRKHTLILAPTVAIMQWRNEFTKFTSGMKVCVWHGGNRSNDAKELLKFDVILTSYAVLESAFRRQNSGYKRKGELLKEQSVLHHIDWHRVILDEAHNIKDRSCNTARGAFALHADFRWCLSGTPLQNRVGELYSLIRFLGADPFAHYYCKRCPCKSLHWRFSNKRTCDQCGHTPMHHICYWNNEILKPIQKYGATLAGHGSAAFEKLGLLLARMMLRRTKVERADDMGLPPRDVMIRRDYFTEEEEEFYTSLYSDVKRQFTTYVAADSLLNNYANVFQLLTRMRQTACHPDMVLKGKAAKALLGDAAAAEALSISTCRICLDESEDAIMSKCRHVFCRECVRQYLETSLEMEPECPVCHLPMTIDLSQDTSEEIKTARQGMLERIDPGKWRTSTKIEGLVEELSKLRTEDHSIKSLVFSQFTSFLDLIARRLQLAGFKIARLQGNMTPDARDRTVKYFMSTPDCTVFLLSLKAGGVALNLTEASRVFIMDPWWNPAAEVQAMDRVHRIGQGRPVLVKRLIIENSIEAKIVELQRKKENMIAGALGDDDQAMGRLTEQDLQFLFTM